MAQKVVVSALIGAMAASVIAFGTPQRQDVATPIAPTIPTANRYQPGMVFLEHANELKLEQGKDYQLLIGNVQFRRGDMYMYCDTAHFYDQTSSLDAFGNVRMEQGDTLFVYADELNYSGPDQLAVLYGHYGNNVRLINNDVKLETEVFNYDLGIDLGYYECGGVLTDTTNRLKSWVGEYSPSTKDANFYNDVVLTSISRSDTLKIYTDTLAYNTDTHMADLVTMSTIVNRDGTIYTTNGTYNTDLGLADLYDRSMVVTRTGRTLIGDTLIYDRQNGWGEARGDMELTDSTRQSTLKGDYGFYNELTDSAYVTGHALALEYSKGDTLYLHGDVIRTFRVITTDSLGADTTNHLVANPRVRFFRSDIQGLCDSLTVVRRDTMMYMDVKPIVWSGHRQITGGSIQVHFNDSTVEWAKLPDTGFIIEMIEDPFYNQLSGKEMLATFVDGDMRHLDVSGNVEAIFLPEESDSTYNKIVNVTSSFLAADFLDRQVQRMKMWPQTSGTTTPLYLAKKSLLYLPRFKWWATLRPQNPMDVFIYPDDMIELMSEPDPTIRRSITAPPAAPGQTQTLNSPSL